MGGAVEAVADGWECQEPGWWTHPVHGGVTREGSSWSAWPLVGLPAHDFKNMREAMAWAALRAPSETADLARERDTQTEGQP